MTFRVATDIGGTFTDLVYVDESDGRLGVAKSPTTPADFSSGVLDAIDMAGISLTETEYLIHGTTVVINALTERTGARTALVTTEGFRDVLEIARGNRPDMYNLLSRKPTPFVPRRRRFEVRERVDREGRVLVPLHLEDLDAVAERCRRDGVEAVAVCFLHSYAYPGHEQAARDRLLELMPEAAITIASDVTREWREYERTSTAVLNGYVQPVVDGYLTNLSGALGRGGLAGDFHVMQSNSGTSSAESVRTRPIYLVESGPAAGIVGAAQLGRQIGEPNVIYLDIGGTTAKCSLIENGEPKTTTQYRIEWRPDFAGYPAMVPVVDIVEIGAGGGSIAWADEGGALRVGPKSAGADPGPACYGQGGTDLTVTDAKLLAGVLNPEYLLGGRLRVYPQLARQAAERFGAAAGASVEDVANGVIRLVNANMVNALKLVSVQRGFDPRDFALVACGGGGPMHAAALGRELQVGRVIVPPLAGVFSAWGMLVTDPRVDLVQTRILATADTRPVELEALFEELESEGVERLRGEGLPAGSFAHVREVDMRYAGQEHTVRVAVPPGPISVGAIGRAFHEEHRRKYTFDLPGAPSQLVTFHVATYARGARRPVTPPPAAVGRSAPQGSRRVVDFDVDGIHETLVVERSELPAGYAASGPLIVEEASSTTLVHPGQALRVDGYGNLVIELEEDR